MGPEQVQVVGLILKALEAYYSSGCNLGEARRIASRFFYKQLKRPHYEAGVESNTRVVLRKEGAKCIAAFAGNHDQVRKFLAKN